MLHGVWSCQEEGQTFWSEGEKYVQGKCKYGVVYDADRMVTNYLGW
jgi:hypothetical protein